jgi:RHH-type proline utilization regulon transcriptional repressor/proline dehydrogenase/delta 1-pyrroline-5-carboxylate dehydrogenase
MLEALATDARRRPAHPRLEHDPWGPVPRVNVSVKPTALTPFFGPLTADRGLAEAMLRLRPIVARAAELGATIHLDAEHDETKDLTLALVRALGAELPAGAHLGCVVQAYRTDAFDDLTALIAWAEGTLATPLQIRLVKGAYWDIERTVAEAEGWPLPVFDG